MSDVVTVTGAPVPNDQELTVAEPDDEKKLEVIGAKRTLVPQKPKGEATLVAEEPAAKRAKTLSQELEETRKKVACLENHVAQLEEGMSEVLTHLLCLQQGDTEDAEISLQEALKIEEAAMYGQHED